jgi:hypothetical protein
VYIYVCVCRPHRPLLGEEEVELAELGDIESGDADGGKMDVSWGEVSVLQGGWVHTSRDCAADAETAVVAADCEPG